MTADSSTRAEIAKWLKEFHDASARLDADQWLDRFFTENATLQYANNPVIRGVDVRKMFEQVFAQLDQMTHTVDYFDYVEPRIYQAATIHYVIKGDDPVADKITIPGFAVFSTRVGDDGLRRCYQAETFLDPSPVFQRMQEKFG